eukprot:scaffold245625_cov33-Tisochrysis_lutea.AAC.3
MRRWDMRASNLARNCGIPSPVLAETKSRKWSGGRDARLHSERIQRSIAADLTPLGMRSFLFATSMRGLPSPTIVLNSGTSDPWKSNRSTTHTMTHCRVRSDRSNARK